LTRLERRAPPVSIPPEIGVSGCQAEPTHVFRRAARCRRALDDGADTGLILLG
jgi:hypothetical protein